MIDNDYMEVSRLYMIESAIIRGFVINAITMLERTIDHFLASHYCKDRDKMNELMASVFASKFSTFENKRMLFNHLLNTFHKEYKETHLKGLHAKLDEFNLHRNRVAHYVLDTNIPALENFEKTKEVIFVKFERSIEHHAYTVESAERLTRDIMTFVEPIGLLTDSFTK